MVFQIRVKTCEIPRIQHAEDLKMKRVGELSTGIAIIIALCECLQVDLQLLLCPSRMELQPIQQAMAPSVRNERKRKQILVNIR